MAIETLLTPSARDVSYASAPFIAERVSQFGGEHVAYYGYSATAVNVFQAAQFRGRPFVVKAVPPQAHVRIIDRRPIADLLPVEGYVS